jgi:hypothetical protein
MARVPVFYSFHFDNDVMRVQQIRQMGMIDGDEPVSKNDWETVKRSGAGAIERWIDEQHEIQALRRRADRHRYALTAVGDSMRSRKAWADKRGLLGIRIHNLKCPNQGTCAKGTNPFDQFNFHDGSGRVVVPPVYDPPAHDAYNHIKNNLAAWVEDAIARRQ